MLTIKGLDIVSLLDGRCCFGWSRFLKGTAEVNTSSAGGRAAAGLEWFLTSMLSQSTTRCGENNHTALHIKSGPDEKKYKHVYAHCLWYNKAADKLQGLRLQGSILRQMPLLKEQRRDLNKLKNLPGERAGGRRRADGMENTRSPQCVHWEEWKDKLKAMAFLAIFTAMRHYWFLRRKCILNVSRDPAFLSLSHSYTHCFPAL